MNAAFSGLADLATLNPKLLVIDLILATNQRPRLMFGCFLLGGLGLAVTVGLLDVFVLHLDAIKSLNHSEGARMQITISSPLGLRRARSTSCTCSSRRSRTTHDHVRRSSRPAPGCVVRSR
jgi:hypothetical protein